VKKNNLKTLITKILNGAANPQDTEATEQEVMDACRELSTWENTVIPEFFEDGTATIYCSDSSGFVVCKVKVKVLNFHLFY